MLPLPIDPWLGAIRQAAAAGHVVVVAPPGSGKTTRVPPLLAAGGPVILLQPRRIAARSLARRIAAEQGWTPGEEVGWQVRFERRYSSRTRLLVVTEGILTARLQSDPLLSDFRTVILDEFHERSIHADLAIALLKQVARAREDLRIVVMSATIDPLPVSSFLGGCPIIEVPGRPYPVTISYSSAQPPQAIVAAASDTDGDVLCFLPGAAEIRKLHQELVGLESFEIRELHGMLPAEQQDAAIMPSAKRKIVLATNIAETSLTVEGVTAVVDSGLHKVARYDPAIGMDRLELERIPADSAEQRAGRAGRTGPGIAIRLWDARAILRPRREPDIARVDLAGPLLDIIGWGEDPRRFEWFEVPSEERIGAALELLEMLHAVGGGKLTAEGRRMHRLSLHPRLARLLLSAGASPEAAALCAILSERQSWYVGPADQTSDSDALLMLDAFGGAPATVRRAAVEFEQIARGARRRADHRPLLRAIFEGYPDRVAKRREPGSPRLVLASGHGAVLARESSVRSGDLIVALDLRAGEKEALVRTASRIEREWLEPTAREVVHWFDERSGVVRAREIDWYFRLRLGEHDISPQEKEAERIIAAELERACAAEPMMARLRFAGLSPDLAAISAAAAAGKTRIPALELKRWLPHDVREAVERLAPESLQLPSGRKARLEYRDDGSVLASAKLQELFGLGETPRIGPRREPILFALLAPNGRPVQMTSDLRSFWANTYPQVRKELRGRYPKHPWPEDPMQATPTHRTRGK